MSFIENAKTYTGRELETIFFRPMLSGPNAEQLGIRVLYNMPVPTTVQVWERSGDILQKYTGAGWTGGPAATKKQKSIALSRVKAEMGYSAADYFSMVYELITNRSDVNMDDLTGTELEKAETELFKAAIAESLRATMWVGDTAREGDFNTFDGFLKRIETLLTEKKIENAREIYQVELDDITVPDAILSALWQKADETLRSRKNEGQLAFFVTSDLYDLYERYLDAVFPSDLTNGLSNGYPTLSYHGIPIIDLHISPYLAGTTLPATFALLTDRRNLTLAVNTADFPGNEIRMWYNPDAMENRQRAVFMAGCEVLDEKLVSYARLVTE